MKFIRHIIIFSLAFVISSQIDAQGIRKHYTELTESERLTFKSAIESTYYEGAFDFYAELHFDPDFDPSTGGLAQTHYTTIFLPWHRQFMLEFESYLHYFEENTMLPYWDWTGESDANTTVDSRSINSPLWKNDQINDLNWSDNLLGEYDGIFTYENGSVDLNRIFISGLPSLSQVNSNLSQSNLNDFYSTFFNTHAGPHQWVGGEMGTMKSPRDPIFYLHHAYCDLVWQKWEENPSNNSTFTEMNMPTFNGNVQNQFFFTDQNTALSAHFPEINPNDIANSDNIGIFYSNAVTQVAKLKNYSVQNNTRDPRDKEIFSYQYTIEAGNDFIIPDTKKAELRSCKVINLTPGFGAASGSVTDIYVDTDCNYNTAEKRDISELVNDNITVTDISTVFPNPFTDHTNIEFSIEEESSINIFLFDVTGRLVKTIVNDQSYSEGTHNVQLNAEDLPSGNYICEIQYNDKVNTKRISLIK